jgi:hypothetical protein
MERFLQQHRDRVIGVLSGFDRIVFRGSLRAISYPAGLAGYLSARGVLYKDFARFAQGLSDQLKTHAQQLAAAAGRPLQYVASAKVSKEELVRRRLAAQPVEDGLIAVLSCVEPCQSFELRRDRERRRLVLVPAQRKCLFLYFYYLDREFGFMHVRLQTWLPFTVQVCLNGREYLARQMDRLGIGYEQRDNCFTRIDDLPRAQARLDHLTTRRWPRVLNGFVRRLNPLLRRASGLDLPGYYWSVRQSEYATDVMFRSPADLGEIYPGLTEHALRHFGSDDVLRFLGRRIQPARFNGEVKTELRRRIEGVRVKHWVEENSLKMYDKQGSVLRIETTLNNPYRFKVRRVKTGHRRRRLHWLPLRKGVADLPRRVAICQAANARYLEALAVVGRPAPVPDLLDPISRPIVHQGRPYRALRPITPDEARLFALVLRGEFRLQGFRNRDLRWQLHGPPPADPQQRRRAAGHITRLLRLLRAHGLIRKVPHTFYYRVTQRGEQIMTTALHLRELDLSTLAA